MNNFTSILAFSLTKVKNHAKIIYSLKIEQKHERKAKMAQVGSPYRDPRDARIEILEAENRELRKRLGETSEAIEISMPVVALSLSEDFDERIERRKQIVKAEKKRNKSNELIIDKFLAQFLAQLFKKMKRIRQAMRSPESITLFKNENLNLIFRLDPDSLPFFYLRVREGGLGSGIHYLNFWGRHSLRIDLAREMGEWNIGLQEIIESTEKNIVAFFEKDE